MMHSCSFPVVTHSTRSANGPGCVYRTDARCANVLSLDH